MYQMYNISGPPSLGVIAYLYTQRKFIPSQFIHRLDLNFNIDNIGKLIEAGYIKQVPNNKPGPFGKPARYFKSTHLLDNIKIVAVTDKRLIKIIDRNLHKLNDWHFNHLYYNYRNIEFKVPYKPEYKHYHINIQHFNNITGEYFPKICIDDKFSGRHHNFFTFNEKDARKYLFNDPVEIDVRFCQPLLLADLMYKGFGNNDFSSYMMNKSNDIYITLGNNREAGKKLFVKAALGVSLPDKIFSAGFPEAYGYLYNIKRGDLNYFKRFCNINDVVHKTDKRLTIQTSDHNYNIARSRGQLHYKAISLKLQSYEVKIMRKVWVDLKKEKILFIPIHDAILTEFGNAEIVSSIIKEQFNNFLNKKFNVQTKIKKIT